MPRSRLTGAPIAQASLPADGLAQRLATAVRTQVEYGRPFSQLSLGKTGLAPEQVQFVEPLAAVPVGLAMGAV